MTVGMQGLSIKKLWAEGGVQGHNFSHALSPLAITITTGVGRIEISLISFHR